MVRTRPAWPVITLALGLTVLAVLGACKKEGSSATGDKSEASGGAAGADDMSLLPADSEVVFGLNLAQLQQSQLWKQFIEPKMASGETQKKMNEFKARCGWDPMTAMSSLAFGGKDMDGNKPAIVLVMHGLDKTKALDCLDKSKDEITKDGTEMTKDGDVVVIKDKNGDSGALTFVNNSTAVLAFGGGRGTSAGVKALVSGAGALKTSPTFVEMYKKVKTSDSLWGVAGGKVLDKLPIKATAAYGSLNVTDGLAVDLRVKFEKAEDATQATSMINSQTKQAAQYFDKAEFTSDGTEMHGVVAMSNQKLQQMIQQFGPMLGMAVGGMGK